MNRSLFRHTVAISVAHSVKGVSGALDCAFDKAVEMPLSSWANVELMRTEATTHAANYTIHAAAFAAAASERT